MVINMEVLSIGEKIKRARIYKGYTLKDICDDKISISKMSCIENNKVEPDEWILKHISKKLNLGLDYLEQNIEQQIQSNVQQIIKQKYSTDYEKKLLYNLEFSREYKYYNLAFEIMHLLFEYYLYFSKFENLQVLTSNYYDLCRKSNSKENEIIYYLDMAKYLYQNKEFAEATNYFRNIRKNLFGKDKYKEELEQAIFYEMVCYMKLKDYQRAYEISIKLIEMIDSITNNFYKQEVYKALAVLSLRLNNGKFNYYKGKNEEIYKTNLIYKADAYYNFAKVMFELQDTKNAVNYILEALGCYPKEDLDSFVKFRLTCIGCLVENNMLDIAQNQCDEVLNYAIDLDNIVFIEKTYYYKSIILQKQGNLSSAEMYMNLSLDSLTKFGSKQEIYKRYMEMGNMYHKIGNVTESLKYFTLALSLKKKI